MDFIVTVWSTISALILIMSLQINGTRPTVHQQKVAASVIIAWSTLCVGMYIGVEYAHMIRIDHTITTGGCKYD